MKHCPACGGMHGVNFHCPKLADSDADPDATKIIPFSDIESAVTSALGIPEKLWLTPPLLPKKLEPKPGTVVGYLSIGGVTYPVTPAILAACGGNLSALVQHLSGKSKPSAWPADVADAFFFAFVDESMRRPLQAPPLAQLLQLLTHFGDTDPRIQTFHVPSASFPILDGSGEMT
jgi:hypothetical protein